MICRLTEEEIGDEDLVLVVLIVGMGKDIGALGEELAEQLKVRA